MAKNYRHSGHTRNITPTTAVSSQQIVMSGTEAGIAVADIAANEQGVINLTGVYRMTSTAHGLAQGDAVHLIIATGVFDDGTAGDEIGVVDEVVDVNTIDVLLNGKPGR